MNLELLDPFGRQIPDRVDATLDYPAHPYSSALCTDAPSSAAAANSSAPSSPPYTQIHPYKPAAVAVAWNRRGNYLATTYANGTTAVVSWLSRSLVALYPASSPPTTFLPPSSTSVSWARRSRTLLTTVGGAAVNDSNPATSYNTTQPHTTAVQLIDLTHPFGPERASLVALTTTTSKADDEDDDGDDPKSSKSPAKQSTAASSTASHLVAPLHPLTQTRDTAFRDTDQPDLQLLTIPRRLNVKWVTPATSGKKKGRPASKSSTPTKPPPRRGKRFPALVWSFGASQNDTANVSGDANDEKATAPPINSTSLQIHPSVAHAGLATLSDGRLVVFYVDPSVWYTAVDEENKGDDTGAANLETMETTSSKPSQNDPTNPESVHVLELTTPDLYQITGATLSPSGQDIYAATADGNILIWKNLDDNTFWRALAEKSPALTITPTVVIPISNKPTLSQLLVSRNGQYLVVNASDGVLRLYKTAALAQETDSPLPPTAQFQDVVNRVRFSCFDFSGDGEYLVGGVDNGRVDNCYELFIWSTATGHMVDTLQGVNGVQLHAVVWHPTRALLAAATSDGIVDIWGPRINWTAFAPDFQALPRNVEYVEREDEFDQKADGTYLTTDEDDVHLVMREGKGGSSKLLNVRKIIPVPAFASDSEDETEVFNFEPRVSSGLKQSSRFKNTDKNED